MRILSSQKLDRIQDEFVDGDIVICLKELQKWWDVPDNATAIQFDLYDRKISGATGINLFKSLTQCGLVWLDGNLVGITWETYCYIKEQIEYDVVWGFLYYWD